MPRHRESNSIESATRGDAQRVLLVVVAEVAVRGHDRRLDVGQFFAYDSPEHSTRHPGSRRPADSFGTCAGGSPIFAS